MQFYLPRMNSGVMWFSSLFLFSLVQAQCFPPQESEIFGIATDHCTQLHMKITLDYTF